MTCEDARVLLLEADPIELAAEGDGPLATHLRSCPDCRALASRLLAAELGLATALDQSVSRHGADDVAHRAMLAARRAGWRRAARWLPLAAAAVLALLLLRRDRLPPPPLQAPTPSAGLDVDVLGPAGRTAAIFRTPDPDIVVVWFF